MGTASSGVNSFTNFTGISPGMVELGFFGFSVYCRLAIPLGLVLKHPIFQPKVLFLGGGESPRG